MKNLILVKSTHQGLQIMFCAQCGNKTSPKDSFCKKCGNKLSIDSNHNMISYAEVEHEQKTNEKKQQKQSSRSLFSKNIWKQDTHQNQIDYKVNSQIPWKRFFARFIDNSSGLFVLGFLFRIITGDQFLLENILWITFSFMLINSFIEALLISVFSTTPGKILFSIKVLSENGTKLSISTSLKRSFLVLSIGQLFSIPILCLIPEFISYYKLKNNNETYWDETLKTKIYVRSFSIWRYILILLILIILANISQSGIQTILLYNVQKQSRTGGTTVPQTTIQQSQKQPQMQSSQLTTLNLSKQTAQRKTSPTNKTIPKLTVCKRDLSRKKVYTANNNCPQAFTPQLKKVNVNISSKIISVDFYKLSMPDFLQLLSEVSGTKIYAAEGVNYKGITIQAKNETVDLIFYRLLEDYHLCAESDNNSIRVSRIDSLRYIDVY